MLTVECQTDCDSVTIISLQKEVAILKSELTRRPKFCVDSILKDDDKLTRFYTGMPTYQSFIAFVDYLQPKALKLTPWNGTHTKEAVIDESKQPGHQGISCLKVCDQLFAVLIRLRRGLDALDVCVRFSISEATYSRLFATWITFLSKELKMLFPFPSREQISQWMPPSFKKYFPNTRIIIDCCEIECQRPLGLMNFDPPIHAIAISRSIISPFLLEPVRRIDKFFAIALISLTLSPYSCFLRLTISSCESSFP